MPPYAGLSGEGTEKTGVLLLLAKPWVGRDGCGDKTEFFLLGQNIVTSELRYETRSEKRLHYKGM